MASFTDTFPPFMSLTPLAVAMKIQNNCIQHTYKSTETLRY